MDCAKVNWLARALPKTINRRQLAGLVGALWSLYGQRVARGSQLGPATCGTQGAVCTLLVGCCNGHTCATSAINTSYGICVPGEGGMITTGTTLISPFSETAVEEVTALVQTSSVGPTTDPKAEREAHIAEIRARRDARRTKQKSRLETKRTRLKTRKEEKKTLPPESNNAANTAEDTLGPYLEFQLLKPGGLTGTETLSIRNRDDSNVLLVKIESVLQPRNNSATNRAVSPGSSFSSYSGISDDISDDDELTWINQLICSGTAGAGFRVTIGANADSVNQQYVVLCDGPSVVTVNEPPLAMPLAMPLATPKRKRKRNNHRRNKNKR
jgi:hypothetical protein